MPLHFAAGFQSALGNHWAPPLPFRRRPPQSNYPPGMVLDPDYGPELELRCRQGGISPSAPPRPKPQVQSVPPILRRQHQNSMPGYSKGAQGLSVYVRVTGIFTGATDSPSALRRQCPNRYAIRAGRNLPDKEFRLNLLLRVYRVGRSFLPTSACRHAVRTFSSN